MRQPALKHLDELLELLSHDNSSAASRIAEEHIRGARAYLLGAMHFEYRLNLELARDAVARIGDDVLREQAEQLLNDVVTQ